MMAKSQIAVVDVRITPDCFMHRDGVQIRTPLGVVHVDVYDTGAVTVGIYLNADDETGEPLAVMTDGDDTLFRVQCQFMPAPTQSAANESESE